MNKAIVVTFGLVLAGCGSFELGQVHPQPGKTAEQQQIDGLLCKDRAFHEANTPGRQAGAFVASFSLIATAISAELEKEKQREVFAECMAQRGYHVTLPDRLNERTTTAARPPSVVRLEFPSGYEALPLGAAERSQGGIQHALNRSLDAGSFVSVVSKGAITDMKAYVASRKALQLSYVSEGQATEPKTMQINGAQAYQYEITGTINQRRITYLSTIIEGSEQIGMVSSWTSADTYPIQREHLASLPARLQGLR